MIQHVSPKVIGQVVNAVLANRAHRATKVLSERLTVKATVPLYDGKLPRRGGTRHDIVLTIGAPNFAERKLIKACRKAGEPIPVRRILLKFPPQQRRAH